MPSPVGHALAGLAAGWMVQGAPPIRSRSVQWRQGLLFASLGMLPDADLLFGAHSGATHSVGAALVVAATALTLWPQRASPRRRAMACAAAYASHLLLDWLGSDSSAPIGIMALWPFTRDYFESDLHVFLAVWRRGWEGEAFWRHNAQALVREVVILGPMLAAVLFLRRRS